MMIAVVFFLAAIFTVMSFFGTFAVLAAIHFAIGFLAAILAVMACHSAFAIGFLAAVFAIMTCHGAFAVFTAIHGTGSGCFPFVLAAAMQFVVSFVCGFETHIVIAYFRNFLLDLGCIGRAALVGNGQFLGLGIPGSFFGAGLFGGFFDFGFAHTAVTGHFECFGLGLGDGEA